MLNEALDSLKQPLGRLRQRVYEVRFRRSVAHHGKHALTFELLDFDRVRRCCDVAAATSPIARALNAEWPGVEYWRQDLPFETDLTRRERARSKQRPNRE